MDASWILLLCALIWGTTTFLNKLSADRMSPILAQIIIGIGFVLFTPLAIKMEGGFGNLKWNSTSVILTLITTFMSIGANILMYSSLSNNRHTGSSTMLISLYPVVTLILSAIFLNEHFSIGKIFGVLAMIGGACLLVFC